MKSIWKRASLVHCDRRALCKCLLSKVDSRARVNRMLDRFLVDE